MKKLFVLVLCSVIMLSTQLSAKDKIRIGVYDSRAIALWNFNSEAFKKQMQDMRAEYNKAKEKGDTAKVKELEVRGPLMQRVLHDKGFGRGSVAEIMEKYKAELKSVATKEKLSAIVSKWEVNFSSDDVELVNITLKLLVELKAGDDVKKMLDDIDKNPPVPDAFFIED